MTMMKFSPRWLKTVVSAALMVAILVVATWLYFQRGSAAMGKTGASAMPSPATAAKTPAATNPLFISDIAARSYAGGPINITQNLGDQGGYTSQVISFTSDGLTEYALQTTPAGSAPAGGWPVVILCHGYIDPAQYRTTGGDYATWIADLTRTGYVVLKPDYRGHGQSRGTAEGGHFSPVYSYDILNLIASLKLHPGAVNPQRLALIGHSMGGHVALRTAVVSPDVKASIYVSGVVGSFYDIVYNWPHPPYTNDQPSGVVHTNIRQLQAEHGDPKSNPDFWNQASTINYVKNLHGPIQIDHGTADDQVPPLFSQHLDAAAKAAGQSSQLYLYSGGDHQFSHPADRALLLQRMETFLQNALKH